MGIWKVRRVREEAREESIERARAEFVSSQVEHQKVLDQAPLVAQWASYLAERRELNHFGEALATSGFEPRRRHV